MTMTDKLERIFARATRLDGFICAVTNPLYPDHVWLEQAFLVDEFMEQVQEFSPHRDFVLEHARYVSNRMKAKADLLDAFADARIDGGDWFAISIAQAVQMMDDIADKYPGDQALAGADLWPAVQRGRQGVEAVAEGLRKGPEGRAGSAPRPGRGKAGMPKPMKRPLQFNWRRHWKKKVEPYLKHDLVQASLDLGMMMLDDNWQRGDPPYLMGREAGRRAVPGKLSWYRPCGCCHWIAFFSMAIGVLNYPELDWRFLTGDLHTVPVGFDSSGEPRVVMDILLFEGMTAEESIDLTKRKPVRRITGASGNRQWEALYAVFLKRIVPLIRADACQPSLQADRRSA
jgi:hypothetical protein